MTWITLPQNNVLAGQSGHLSDHDDVYAALSAFATAGLQGVVNVTAAPYGAKVDGSTDDTAALQAALSAAAPGSIVWLPPGTTVTSAPIYIPPQVELLGAHSSHLDSTAASCIKPSAGFTGAAVILIVDQATGGYSIPSNQQSIRNITLDGSNLTGSTIDGLQAQGSVHGVIIEDVQIRSMPNHGINNVSNGSGFPYSWRGTRLVVQACAGYGYAVGGTTDSTWIDCEALGCLKSGFLLASQPSNSKFIGCRSEYSTWNGFEISGTWTGANYGGGGATMVDCSTDANNRNGILITATGDSPLSIIGGNYRRDGWNGGAAGSGYAAIQCTGSTIPVKITAPMTQTGFGEASGQTVPSPQYGLAVISSSSTVSVEGGTLHGNTAAWFDDGSNSSVQRGANVVERVGGQTGYTTAFHGLQASLATPPTWDSGPSTQQYSLVAARPMPEDLGYIALTGDHDAFSSTVAPSTGVIYLAKVVIRRPVTATNIVVFVTSAGATLTSGQNLAGIYSSTGTLLRATADQSAVWTSTGLKTMALTTTIALVPGTYYVAILSVGTTPPTLIRSAISGGGASGSQAFYNVGATSSTPKSAVTAAGQTTLPAITLSATTQNAYVFGVYLT